MKVWWKSFFWIVVLNVGLILFSWSLGGRAGLAWGFFLALSINYYLILYPPLKKLAPKGAEPLEGRDPWEILTQVEEMSQRLKVPSPKVYLWESEQVQCFVFSKWPGRASFGLSQAALKNLNPEEIQLLITWALVALKSGRVINWTYLGLFLNLIFIFLSSVDRILSWMVTQRINRPHGITLWIMAPLIFLIQRMFCSKADFLAIDRKLEQMGLPTSFSSTVVKKIHFQNQVHPAAGNWAFAHLYFSSQIPRGGLLPLLRVQPSYKKRVRALRGSYPV